MFFCWIVEQLSDPILTVINKVMYFKMSYFISLGDKES